MFVIRQVKDQDIEDLVSLWEMCNLTRPWNNPEIDAFRKLQQKDGLFLVAEKDQRLIASIMGGYDGHRGWIHYLAVHPHYQRLGVATALMQQMENRLTALGCPKVQLLVRQENLAVSQFYDQLGYEEVETVCLGKRLIQD
ncbi:GNAT family acetyltransferase [Acinetobacter sp. ME22]|uniref:GNAT family acetyltransferase n=1 Tax=Acinetobacter sp. ME22 TaxID=2904802 RepID=UPI001EDBB36B|nr:GNAT family acetyltransferase [Acinetobacter sp. ME22]MCG2573822.1 GNAT family acetyltransferase [Acinetobacter sp. ME22]